MTTILVPIKQLSVGISLIYPKQVIAKVVSIKNSIAQDGLLNPLVVSKRRGKYIILDGKKRLQAIRRLIKERGQKGYSTKIPCILQEDLPSSPQLNRPALLSDTELAHAITTQINLGVSYPYIAQRFDCDITLVKDVATLGSLHKKVLQCFNNRTLSLAQVVALATIPNPTAQWDLLLKLGPFVSNQKIINAIKEGETVISLSDDNIIIIPSRKKLNIKHFDKVVKEPLPVITQRLAA